MSKIIEELKKDESSIAKGNGAELFCYFLFKYLQEKYPKLENRIIKNIEITHHNYGGSQKCDLQIKFNFEKSTISQTIYVESKNYSCDDTKRNDSIEKSVKQFTKKGIIDFGDIYMVFIPGQNNLSKAIDYLNQSSKSKDCNFPRRWFQISNELITTTKSSVIQDAIKTKIFTDKKKIDINKIEETYEELKSLKEFNDVLEGFSKKIGNELDETHKLYIKDEEYEKFGYKELYEVPDLKNIISSSDIIKKVLTFFAPILPGSLTWKQNAEKNCQEYLTKKRGYQKYQHLIQKIEAHESYYYNEIFNYIKNDVFASEEEFHKKILDTYSYITDETLKAFLGNIIGSINSKRGLFYGNIQEQISMSKNHDGFYIHDKRGAA